MTSNPTAVLTTEQTAIVNHHGSHVRCIAVPGSGKTHTLTHYVSQRLEAGVDTRRMLIVMYNKMAQVDFAARLKNVCHATILPEIKTFHALGLKIYQRLIKDGHLPKFSENLLVGAQVENLVRHLLQAEADGDVAELIRDDIQTWVDSAVNFITLVKSNLSSAADVFEEMDLPRNMRILVDVFESFEKERKKTGRITFDDMLYDPCLFLYKNPDIAATFSNHMVDVIVDEFQDINAIQFFLVKTIAGERASVVCVGDPDQTIYEFRGSRPELLLREFSNAFQNTKTYTLSHTFRYGHALALAAHSLISHNKQREFLICSSGNTTPDTRVSVEYSEEKHADIVKYVSAFLKDYKHNDIAILSRNWTFLRPIELALLKARIPYVLSGGVSVFNRRELQPIKALLLGLSDQWQSVDMASRTELAKSLCVYPSMRIPHAILDKLVAHWVSYQGDFPAGFKRAIQKERSRLTPYQLNELEKRSAALDSIKPKNDWIGKKLSHYLKTVRADEYLIERAGTREAGREQLETILAMIDLLESQGNITAKDALSLWDELEVQSEQDRCNGLTSRITLTTMHRSKGLEWPVVILPNLTAKQIPYISNDSHALTPFNVESERRLLYVAITRAQDQLFLIAPQWSDGKGEKPSPFLKEMNIRAANTMASWINDSARPSEIDLVESDVLRSYLSAIGLPPPIFAKRFKEAKQLEKVVTHPHTKGSRIEHSIFGRGRILASDSKVTIIRFDESGEEKTFVTQTVINFLTEVV